MSTYTGGELAPTAVADPSGFNNGFPIDVFVAAILDVAPYPLRKSDTPNNVFDPTVPVPLFPAELRSADFTVSASLFFSGGEYEGFAPPIILVATFPGLQFSPFSGDAWVGSLFVILAFGFNEDDFQVLAGRVFDADTGLPLPNIRLHFEAVDINGEFRASKADANGGYVAILTPQLSYNVAGSNELLCLVFELDRIEPFPDRTDIYLRVPDICKVPVIPPMAGEPLEDVLNREIGYHNYEPVKTATAIRPDKELRQDGNADNVAVNGEVAVVDFVADSILLIESILISSSGDAEFYFVIGENLGVVSIPRRRLNVDVPQDDLLGAGSGRLAVNAGQRVRVIGKNVSEAVSNVQATILGKKA